MARLGGGAAVLVLTMVGTTGGGAPRQATSAPPTPTPAATPTPAPPQIEFPGQYDSAPAAWLFPVWPSGCRRFTGEERTACLEFVASDFGRLSRFAGANAAFLNELGGASGAPPRPPARSARVNRAPLAALPPGKIVVFFGDSITDNWSKAGYGGFFPGKPYLNRGIGGQTTSQMLLRFHPDVIALRPDAVVILAGTNDIAGNSGPVSLEVVEQNLATMAELAKLHGIRVVLASVLPVSDDKHDPEGRPLLRTQDRPPAKIRELNAWMQGYARRSGHVYLDYFSATADASSLLKPDLNNDGLHPNAAGYAVMAPRAEQAIAEALTRR